MHTEDKTFNLRFSLEATFSEHYQGTEDEHIWAKEWEHLIKPQLLKEVFTILRAHSDWTPRIRNRGMTQEDEIEIVLTMNF